MNGAYPDIFQEVISMNCNSNGLCGFGGNNWWWIIILILLFCNNGGYGTYGSNGCCDNNCGCC